MLDFLYSFVFPYINFAIFISLLVYFGKKPFLVYGKNKLDTYKAECSQAQTAYQTSQTHFKKINQRLNLLKEELKSVGEVILQDVRLEQEKIINENKQDIVRLQVETKRVCELYKNKIISEIKQEIWQQAQGKVFNELRKLSLNKANIIEELELWQHKQGSEDLKKGRFL